MAEVVSIDGKPYLKRRPIAVLLLTVVTLFVYWVIWYYKINNDARRYLRDPTIKPWLSALAIAPGLILIVPPFISIYRTGTRIRRMESSAAIDKPLHPLLGVLCALLTSITLIFAGGTGYYYQQHLNTLFTKAAR
ncbi:DUF4234 domain-containing protein [Microlunatus elymi]|uniref:DUF4234 domain-containing protein n=1 Tax=Microlunatus elymi TaxID=2596828 RepID=A0A516PW28_9ACTN|nr:DUF4234 domain-containing protein [Microlunatus elymi]QDP95161.1 DUF4234 domain-containing protein [Microlunatus elymi]